MLSCGIGALGSSGGSRGRNEKKKIAGDETTSIN